MAPARAMSRERECARSSRTNRTTSPPRPMVSLPGKSVDSKSTLPAETCSHMKSSVGRGSRGSPGCARMGGEAQRRRCSIAPTSTWHGTAQGPEAVAGGHLPTTPDPTAGIPDVSHYGYSGRVIHGVCSVAWSRKRCHRAAGKPETLPRGWGSSSSKATPCWLTAAQTARCVPTVIMKLYAINAVVCCDLMRRRSCVVPAGPADASTWRRGDAVRTVRAGVGITELRT